MAQTKKQSFIESITNVFIGYLTAFVSQLLIFPLFEIKVSIQDNLMIWLYFTIISLIRSYIIRRYFNVKQQNKRRKKNVY